MKHILFVITSVILLVCGCISESNQTGITENNQTGAKINETVTEKAILDPSQCFYNSTAETITCGRPLVIVPLCISRPSAL